MAAKLPAGYVLTGGGAQVHYTGAGNFLTASYPVGSSGWEGRGKDHAIPDPAAITAYAIGLRHRTGAIPVTGTVVAVTEPGLSSHPLAWASLDLGWIPSGGGALTSSHGPGNLLTGSFPVGLSWAAAAKDHVHASGATMTAFVLGIREG